MAQITDNNINFTEYTPQQFVGMMQYLSSFMTNYLPFTRRDGIIYLFKNTGNKQLFDQMADDDLEGALQYVHMSWREGADKMISINMTTHSQNKRLLGSTGNKLEFTYQTLAGTVVYPESVTINVTFECNGAVQTYQQRGGINENISINIDNYLKKGKNTITIRVIGLLSKVSSIAEVEFEMAEMSVTSDFPIAKSHTSSSESIQVTATGISDGNAPLEVEFYYDGVKDAPSSMTLPVNKLGSDQPHTLLNLPTTAGQHFLQYRLKSTIDGSTQYSRMMFHQFTVSGSTDRFVNLQCLMPTSNVVSNLSGFYLTAQKLVPLKVEYGYVSGTAGESVVLDWSLVDAQGNSQTVGNERISVEATSNNTIRTVDIIAKKTGQFTLKCDIKVKQSNQQYQTVKSITYPVTVGANPYGLDEATGAVLNLSARGRSNDEDADVRKTWGGVATFTQVGWTPVCGWYADALCLSGGGKVELDCAPFAHMTTGDTSVSAAVEVEYETFAVKNENVPCLTIGNIIKIYGNRAVLRSQDGTVQRDDRFPTATRLKHTFVIHRKSTQYAENQLAEIITNGVTSRGAGFGNATSWIDLSKIIIGGTDQCGIKVYNIKVYQRDISASDALNHTIIDSDADKMASLVDANSIYDEYGNLDLEALKARIPCMKFTGKGGTNVLQTIWNSETKVQITADAKWTDPLNQHLYDFEVTNMRTRSHGQSTLKNPMKSLKIWLKDDGSDPLNPTEFKHTVLNEESGETSLVKDESEDHRWQMKKGAMPMNKFVLQCYYIDSSNCKSPAQLSIINDVLIKAGILTPPQRYALYEYKKAMGVDFPYTIRTTPDSIPCIVTAQDSPSDPEKLVGIFVLMDDKKSDYLYGERSIYPCPGDPFCFEHDKDEFKDRVLWDNSEVTRFEYLSNVHPVSACRGYAQFDEGQQYNLSCFYNSPIVYTEEDDDPENVESEGEGGEQTPVANAANYAFEQALEIIYPDYDDFYNKSGVFNNIKYMTHVNRLYSLLKWAADCYDVDKGGTGSQTKFQKEATAHMDLDHWAAYYLISMLNGCFDSLVRNMQLTTFESVDDIPVFLPMWWDIDIQYGTVNSGPLTYFPPLDRQSDNGDAFRGKTSWIWQALEAWTVNRGETGETFLSRLRRVMNALTTAGYSVQSLVERQAVYTSAWPSALYNESQMVKYKQMYYGDKNRSAYLAYMLGDGTIFRQWWMEKQFNYWFARLASSEFVSKSAWLRVYGDPPQQKSVRVTYANATYFGWTLESQAQLLPNQAYSQVANPGTTYTATALPTNSQPVGILSPTDIKTYDCTEYAPYLAVVSVENCYNANVGTSLEELRIGIATPTANGTRNQQNLEFKAVTGSLAQLRIIQMQGFVGNGTDMLPTIDLGESVLLEQVLMKGSKFPEVLFPVGAHLSQCQLPDQLRTLTWENLTMDTAPRFYDADTLDYALYPKAMSNLTMKGMCNTTWSKAMVLGWLQYIVDNDIDASLFELTLTSISWDMTYDELVLLGNAQMKAHRTLEGKVTVDAMFTDAQMKNLQSLYNDLGNGINVFDLASPFVIDCRASGFVLSAPTEIIAGNTSLVSASVFPLTSSGYSKSYILLNAWNAAGVEQTVSGQTFRSFTIDKVSGSITVLENAQSTEDYKVRIKVTAINSSDANDVKEETVDITVKARTYPVQSEIVMTGKGTIDSTGTEDYTLSLGQTYESATADMKGGIQTSQWTLDGAGDSVSITQQTLTSCRISVTDLTERTFQVKWTATTKTGKTLTQQQTVSIMANPNEAILSWSDEWAHPLLTAFLSAGACASITQMTKAEARALTYLPTGLSNNPDITFFDALPKFVNLMTLIMQGDANLSLVHSTEGTALDISPLQSLTDINISGSHTNLPLSGLTRLKYVHYGTPTEIKISGCTLLKADSVTIETLTE